MRKRSNWRVLVLGLLPGLPILVFPVVPAGPAAAAALVACSGTVELDESAEEDRSAIEERIEHASGWAPIAIVPQPADDRRATVERVPLQPRAPPTA